MSVQPNTHVGSRMLRLGVVPATAAYVIAYALGSWADLGSTALALQVEGASETNIFFTSGGSYSAADAMGMTIGGGVVMTAVFVFGYLNMDRISDRWLRRPVLSFATFYMNPWSRRFIDRSPLHYLSLAVGYVALRLLAGINNSLIAADLPGPLGLSVHWLGKQTTPLTGFALAVGGLYLVLSIILTKPVAWAILRQRQEDAPEDQGTSPKIRGHNAISPSTEPLLKS
jgi:hypothetical protein